MIGSRMAPAALAMSAVAALLAAVASVALGRMNQSLQAEVAERQQFVQQSLQLEGLYRDIVRGLAELGARHQDEPVRELLQRHGISYTVNEAAKAAASAKAKP